VGWDQQQEKRGTVLSKPAQRMNPEHLGLYWTLIVLWNLEVRTVWPLASLEFLMVSNLFFFQWTVKVVAVLNFECILMTNNLSKFKSHKMPKQHNETILDLNLKILLSLPDHGF
jgi:hypothetical protein